MLERSDSYPNRRVVAVRLGLGLLLWAVVAIWLVPLALSLAHRGALPLADLLLRGRATISLSEYQELWRWSAVWATALGGTVVVMAVERRWLGTPALSVAVLIAATFLFHFAALRDGIWYNSDAALYLIHARSIVEGTPYADTGYLVNPTHFHSPPTYPPLFPLMLAPIYAVAGLDLYPMKVLIVATTALATGALYLLARRVLPVGPSLAVGLIFAFSPAIGWLKEDLASDIPFLAIVFLCLWVAEKAQDLPGRTDAGWKQGAVVGLLCFAAVATRSIGIVLLPALLIADILRVRRLSRYGAALLLVAMSLIGLQEALLGNVGAYAAKDQAGGLRRAVNTVVSTGRLLSNMMFETLPQVVVWVGAAVAIAAAAYGTVVVFLRRWSPTALFLGGYTMAVILWPSNSGARILLPQLALGLIFIFAVLWPADPRPRWPKGVAAVLVALFATSYALRYHRYSRAPFPNSFDRPVHAELVAFVNRETSPNDVFISIAPRTLALLTRRTGSIYDIRLPLEDQWRYFASIHARYLVLDHRSSEKDRSYLERVIAAYSDRLRLAFSNQAYQVYRIASDGAR
jgi:hypothetical protein